MQNERVLSLGMRLVCLKTCGCGEKAPGIKEATAKRGHQGLVAQTSLTAPGTQWITGHVVQGVL